VNHRERVISTIKFQPTDRIPFDVDFEDATVEKIFQTLGHRDFNRLLEYLDVDFRRISAEGVKDKNCGEYYQNFWGERYVLRKTKWGIVREDLPGALSNARSFNEIKNFDWPSTDLFDYSCLDDLCKKYDGYSIIYGFADIWQRPCLVRGMENALIDMVENPDWMHFLSRKFTDFYKEDYYKAYKAANGRIDIFLVISDLGSQNGLLISPDMFDEFVYPYLKELTDHIHNLGAYVMFHSCGNIFPCIEKLIEIGIDILDPIQPASTDMSPENLSNLFGGKICFHGGIDIQSVMVYGSPQDIINEVERYKKAFAETGGYICAPSHKLQPDIPVDNIFAIYGKEVPK